jgi:SPX domain
MHFGKFLKSHQFEPWSDKYLDYKHLKTVLERDEKSEKAGNAQIDLHLSITESSRLLSHVAVSLEFASLLDEEVEKVIIFFLQQQGSVAQQLYQLRQEHKRLLADATSSCQPQCWNTLYERYHATAVDLLHLIQYVDLNLTGIRKILKKHDKITGRGLSSRYLTRGNTDNERPFLSPLFEQGGVDSLALKLEDSFDELYMYQQQARPRKQFFRSDTTPDSDIESKQHPDPDNTRFNTYHGDLSSLMDNASPLHGEHVLREIRNARQKMKETRDFVHILAAQMLLMGPEGEEEESIPGMEQHDAERDRKRRISNRLNFISTFLHLTDYYIVGKHCMGFCCTDVQYFSLRASGLEHGSYSLLLLSVVLSTRMWNLRGKIGWYSVSGGYDYWNEFGGSTHFDGTLQLVDFPILQGSSAMRHNLPDSRRYHLCHGTSMRILTTRHARTPSQWIWLGSSLESSVHCRHVSIERTNCCIGHLCHGRSFGNVGRSCFCSFIIFCRARRFGSTILAGRKCPLLGHGRCMGNLFNLLDLLF